MTFRTALSPKSCSFGLFSLALLGILWFLGIATVKRIHLKHQIFCNGSIYFFKRPLFKSFILLSSVSFYLKRGVLVGHSFFQTYLLLLEDQLEPPILSCKVIYFTEQLQPSILSEVLWNR